MMLSSMMRRVKVDVHILHVCSHSLHTNICETKLLKYIFMIYFAIDVIDYEFYYGYFFSCLACLLVHYRVSQHMMLTNTCWCNNATTFSCWVQNIIQLLTYNLCSSLWVRLVFEGEHHNWGTFGSFYWCWCPLF